MPKQAPARGRRAPSPLYETIYDVLREHIVDGSFSPGLVLGEALVARAFQASRIPAGAALRRLHREGLVSDFDGRGYLAGTSSTVAPVRLELAEAGLRLPEAIAGGFKQRNRRDRIYPDVEHSVAACLAYGRFLLNESALAEHYHVSRTVAHEVLTRLERTGLVVQDVNQRWYAGPLTTDLLREHYEVRWLLEPAALLDAATQVTRDEIEAKLARLAQKASAPSPRRLEQLEADLHVDIVLRCRNRLLRETIRRSQLPILATHATFDRRQVPDEIATMLSEHNTVLRHLGSRRFEAAAAALREHLRRSLEPNIEVMRKLGPLSADRRPPYLVPSETVRSFNINSAPS
jgi:DNA-binding GntR family transcriptional regulator